ncbi:hypothetical protein RF11_00103 [Thelohanellus kitauei]|uniref:Uncharacterized protein n=1 Tax=Thelohanellus kitauei TaxID=669202 RepID=A0A0C2NDF1_THEKT|nr:hypothetical protein RF11_00103 [Thelohanellus kitauei]
MKIQFFLLSFIEQFNEASSDDDKWQLLLGYVQKLKPEQRLYFDSVINMLQRVYGLHGNYIGQSFLSLVYSFSGVVDEPKQGARDASLTSLEADSMFPTTGLWQSPPEWRDYHKDKRAYSVLLWLIKNYDYRLDQSATSPTEQTEETAEV